MTAHVDHVRDQEAIVEQVQPDGIAREFIGRDILPGGSNASGDDVLAREHRLLDACGGAKGVAHSFVGVT